MTWTPPADMEPAVAKNWKLFYAACWTKYGITPEQYRALYLAQHGRCYICRKARGKHPDDPKGRGAQRLGVDHNHMIGDGKPEAVRALLCTLGDSSCNRIIGWLSPAALVRAHGVVFLAPAQTVLNQPDLSDDQLMKVFHD